MKPERKARYIYLKGWIVEEKRGRDWVRIHEGLSKAEARWLAYGD